MSAASSRVNRLGVQRAQLERHGAWPPVQDHPARRSANADGSYSGRYSAPPGVHVNANGLAPEAELAMHRARHEATVPQPAARNRSSSPTRSAGMAKSVSFHAGAHASEGGHKPRARGRKPGVRPKSAAAARRRKRVPGHRGDGSDRPVMPLVRHNFYDPAGNHVHGPQRRPQTSDGVRRSRSSLTPLSPLRSARGARRHEAFMSDRAAGARQGQDSGSGQPAVPATQPGVPPAAGVAGVAGLPVDEGIANLLSWYGQACIMESQRSGVPPAEIANRVFHTSVAPTLSHLMGASATRASMPTVVEWARRVSQLETANQMIQHELNEFGGRMRT